MFGIGTMELLVIMLVALMVLGPRKLPEIAKTMGKAMAEFKRVSSDFQRTIDTEIAREERQRREEEEAKRQAAKQRREVEAAQAAPATPAAPAESAATPDTAAASPAVTVAPAGKESQA